MITITITEEDLLNSGPYKDPFNCPMARALKKALNKEDISFAVDLVRNTTTKQLIGRINPLFMVTEYKQLREGVIKEFVTVYTPNK